MSKQTINIGASPNDGTGTPLRTSFDYTNQNFTELYTALGGGVGLPGATTQVIFNDGGTNLAGDAGLVYNKTTDALTVAGLVTAGSATITGALDAARLNVTAATIPANGVYLVTTNKIGFSTNSTQRLTIDATGNLENTTTATQNGFLQFSNTIDGGTLGYFGNPRAFITGGATSSVGIRGESSVQFSIGANLGMTLNSTGLGVGLSPTYKLQSVGIAAATSSTFNGSAGNLIGAMLNSDDANSGTNPGVDLRRWTGTALNHGVTYIATNATGDTLFYNGTAASNTRATSLKMTLDANGRLLLGKTASALGNAGIESAAAGYIQSTVTSDASLFCNRLATDGETIKFYRETLQVGNISVTTLATTYNSISDYRLKEAVQPLSGGLARVNALKPSIYKWKVNGSDGEGFLAHELASVVSAAVTGEKDAVNEDGSINAQSVDMSRIVPILVAAIQELTARVQTLEAR